MTNSSTVTRRYLVASDFDQTLSFNDSGRVLSELVGIPDFAEKAAGLARANLVQQGAELAYLLRHDPEFRSVRKKNLVEAGKRVRLKNNVDLLAAFFEKGVDGYSFPFYVLSASPQDVVQSALAGIVPADRIFGTQLEYDASTGEISSIIRVSAGYGKIAVLQELQSKLQITPDHTIYMGDGSSDLFVMMQVNSQEGYTIAVSKAKFLDRIAKRTVLSDSALSVLVPILEDILKWSSAQIREVFESFGLSLQEWDKARTDRLTFQKSNQFVPAIKKSPVIGVSKEAFGKMPDGTDVEKYTLSNAHGITVSILTYGGIVQTIYMPDKNEKLGNVSLGFDNLEDYIKESPYFGAIIGRYGNRIAKGQFSLDGKQYQIPTNDGPNALHGGPKGFDKEVWAATPLENSNWVGVQLTYVSPDGQMGFPGNLAVTVRYTLNNDNELRIDYSAVTDKDTIVNLTNHTFFNLAGAGNGTVLDQVAIINADKITPIDKRAIPTGELQDVKGTPFDFTKPMAIGARIHADDEQLKNAEPKQGGYDHNWVFNNPGNLNALAARVTDPESGRTVEMYTTEPGVQFYTGNFLDGSLKGTGGLTYDHWGAFTLEAQHYPDSPNHTTFPSTELKPGEKYSQSTIYKFLPM